VLLVDDEQEVINLVIRKIDWESLGFQVIGYAQNGEEAIELAELETPDVVVTDIKMPFMDGLTLSRKLKKKYEDIKIIIFSGFDEFEYAREAIKIEVEEYILKPIHSEELSEILRKLKESLDKERSAKWNIAKLQQYYENSLPILRDQFFISLIQGRIEEDFIENYKIDYQIHLDAPYYVIAIMHMKDPKEKVQYEIRPELMRVSLRQFTDESLEGYCSFKSFFYFGDVIYILMLSEDYNMKECTDKLDKICKRAGRIFHTEVVAGLGKVYDQLSMLQYSYEGAKNAMFYKEEEEEGQAVYIDEIEPLLDEKFVLYDQNVDLIIREIKIGDKENLEKQINDFIHKIKEIKRSIYQYQIILMGVVTEMYKLAGSYQLDGMEIFGGNLDLYSQILKIESLDGIRQWMLGTCMKIRRSIRKERTNTAQVLIQKAEDYIGVHYGDSDLSIEKICHELNVSSAYFSTIFKRETGKTFLNYLTDTRMEKAILLLDGTEEKSYVISEKIGYSEPNYFSYVFKKKYGISPSKYRKLRLEQKESDDQESI